METVMENLEAVKVNRTTTQKEAPAVRSTGKAKSKTGLRLVIAGVALTIAVAGASVAYFHFRDRVSTDDAQVDARIALIAPKIFGNVSEILVGDNEQVKA